MTGPYVEQLARLASRFETLGGEVRKPMAELSDRMRGCRAIVFDWDGVFNSGSKGSARHSQYSEPDSMGTNMLRYGMWRHSGTLPFSALISGASNQNAVEFACREHFSEVYLGVQDKGRIIEHLCARDELKPEQIACVFDDINDLPMAERCGLRFLVRRSASPLFFDYVERHALCDYVTGATGGAHAVREICEFLLGVAGEFDAVVASRAANDDDYRSYFALRQAATTCCFSERDGRLVRDDG